MMMRLPVLALLLALSACGLRPMYAGGSDGVVASGLGTVALQSIPGRSGWLVRKELAQRLGEASGEARYRLEVELDDDITGFGIRGDRAATRERRTLRARYRLVDLGSGGVVLDATAGSDAGVDVVSSQYATIAAEQSALERLSAQIADQIVGRVALYLSASGGAK